MSNAPLMPMATAVWLVENTTLTFKQIADFCKLHEVEIQGIADGEVAKGIKALIPFATSPSAIPCISTSCSLQKSAICLNVRVVFSTNQTAVAIGIKGAFDI